MQKRRRGLAAFCPIILTGSILDAQPKAEVIVDVVAMQVNSGHADRMATTMVSPADLLSALVTDATTDFVSKSQLHISEGTKGQLQIGDEIPSANGEHGVGAVAVNPSAQTLLPLAGTGLTVTIQPQIHASAEVALHVELNVAAVKQYVSLGGVSQPVISRRKSSADLRLREGEVNILGGFQNTSIASGVPGLVNTPALGRTGLDSGQELLIALIAHIVPTR